MFDARKAILDLTSAPGGALEHLLQEARKQASQLAPATTASPSSSLDRLKGEAAELKAAAADVVQATLRAHEARKAARQQKVAVVLKLLDVSSRLIGV